MDALKPWLWPHIPLIVLSFFSMTYSHALWEGEEFSWAIVSWGARFCVRDRRHYDPFCA